MNLRITDLTDLSNYIKNFGSLIVQQLTKTLQLDELDQERNETQLQPNKPRQTWNRSLNIDQLSIFTSRTNNDTETTDRTLPEPVQFTSSRPVLAPIPRPTAFTITHSSTSNRRLLETLTQNNTTNNNINRVHSPVRSNTFVLESSTDQANSDLVSSQTRRLDTNEMSRSRRFRPRTPLTFNVMLNEPNSNIQFDHNDTSALYTSRSLLAPGLPSVDYSTKRRAKLIFGKKGKNNGDLIWPCDVCINQFNNQIAVSDSGNNRVQLFDSNGRFVKKFGGPQGNELGQFNSLSGIFIDSMGNIYLTDRLNHR